jgi:hypothetical protein
LGLTAVTAWVLYSWWQGKNAATASTGSYWNKFLLAVGVGGAAFVGYQYWKGAFTMNDIKDKAKEKLADGKKAVIELVQPWTKYGLEKQPYENAVEIYRTEREDGVEKIENIFSVKNGEDNPKYEAFMKEMREKYTTHEINGIYYARADIALYNYEQGMQEGVQQMIQWMDDHWTELLFAGAALYQLGVLRSILTTGKGAALTCITFSKEVSSFGIKSITKHPIMSILALGGSVYALKEAKENIYLPESLLELSKVAGSTKKKNGKTQKIIQGKTKQMNTEKLELEIRQQAENMGVISGSYMTWIKAKVNDFLRLLVTELPNMLALTKEEVIAKRSTEGMNALMNILESGKTEALTSTQQVNAGMPEKYAKALKQLQIFREAYIMNRCGDKTDSDLPQQEFSVLQTLLKDVGIEIEIKNNLVKWKDGNMQDAFDLCVDPSIKNKARIYESTDTMRQSESDFSYIGSRLLEHIRELQQEALDKGELPEWIGKNGIISMTVGNFMYCFEFDATKGFIDWGNVGNYVFVVPLKAGLDLLNIDKTWTDTGSTFAKGAITSMAFSVGMAPLTKIKRLMIGGGPMIKHVGKSVKHTTGIMKILSPIGRAFRHIPIVSQALYVPQAIGTYGDVATIRRLGFLPGRFVNEMCRKGGIRPEWALALEDAYAAKDMKKINEISGKLGRGHNSPGQSIDDFYKQTRAHFADRLEHVNMREWTTTNWGTRAKGIDISNGDDAYEWILGKKPIPKASPAGAIPSSGGSAGKPSLNPNPVSNPANPNAANQNPTSTPANTNATPNGSAVDPLEAARQAAHAEKVEEVLKIPRIAKTLEGITDPAQLAKIREILNALSTEEIEAIFKSRKAVNLLKGSLQTITATSDMAELTHVVTAAKNAQVLRTRIGTGWNGAGVVGDLFGAYMAYCDWRANSARITATDNPALKELYSTANYLYAAEGGSSVAGIVIGGISFLPAGNVVSVALGAPAGFVMLPIAALVIAAREAHQGLEKSAEYHLLDERDLMKKYSPGQILQHISSTNPSFNLNWQQDWLLNADSAREGNEGARNEGYRAYFAQIASATLPPVDPADAGIEKSMTEEQKLFAVLTLQRERISGFVRDAMAYIAYKTDKEFTIAAPEILHNAALYAEMQFDKRESGETTKSPAAEDKAYWIKMDTTISERALASYEKITKSISDSSKNPNLFEQELPTKLLYLLRDDLAACELKILNTDYSNWGTWSAWVQWKGDEQMRSVARGIFADQTWDVLHAAVNNVRTNNKTLTPKDIDGILAEIKTVLRQNPDSIARKALKTASDVSYFEKIGERNTRLTAPGLQDMLRIYTLSKPTALRVLESTAFNMKSLEFHYQKELAQRHKHPIELIIPVGESKEGYLQIDEPLWMSDGGNANTYKPVGYSEGPATLKLEAGHYYSFRRKASMQVRDDSNIEETLEANPNMSPDLEIITIDPSAPVQKESETTYAPNQNIPSF